MVQLVTRQGKGSALTIAEFDQNLINLNDGIANSDSTISGVNTKLNSIGVDALLSNSAKTIHRGPNTVGTIFIYDTKNDSDGGAWTDKCQHTSWYNESICNNWLGQHNSETAARYYNATVGPTVVLNGTFAADSNWTKGTGWTIANGVATKTSGTASVLSQSVLVTPGVVYRLVITVTRTAGTLTPRLTGGTTVTGSGITASDTYTQYLAAVSGNITLEFSADASFAGTIDNISLVPIVSWNTGADDYFQLITDGKFYKLNKNLLTGTATLATQTQWLSIGTYVLSSTTASSGSVAISGAAIGTHTAGGTATVFTVAKSGNVTFTVTGSVTTAQCEAGSTATAYQANTTSRITETFRGNKRNFPKIAAFVTESYGPSWAPDGSMCIYDLTESNNPMWMRFPGSVLAHVNSSLTWIPSVVNGTFALFQFGNSSSAEIVRFTTDTAILLDNNNGYVYSMFNIANRISVKKLNFIKSHYVGIVESGKLIKPKYSILNSNNTYDPVVLFLSQYNLFVSKENELYINTSLPGYGHSAGIGNTSRGTILIQTSVTTTPLRFSTEIDNLKGTASFTTLSNNTFPDFVRGLADRISNTINEFITLKGSQLGLLRLNELNKNSSLGAIITNTYNTGWQVGDIRRTYLSNIFSSSLGPTEELVINGEFTANTDNWILTRPANATFIVSNGIAVLDQTAWPLSEVYQQITVVPGRSYVLKFRAFPMGGNYPLGVSVGTTLLGTEYYSLLTFDSSNIERTVEFVATTSTLYITFYTNSGTNDIAYIDYVRLNSIELDRSYKNSSANVIGTLTRTPVNTGAQLVGYSGWSNTNYFREPYSADLDFGTGEWSASAWVNVPASLATSQVETYGGDVLNGAGLFTDPSKWSGLSADAVIANGSLTKLTGSTHYIIGEYLSNISPGDTFLLEVDVTSVIGTPYISFGHAVNWNTFGYFKNGKNYLLMTATAFQYGTRIILTFNGAQGGIFSNLTLKRVKPLTIFSRRAASGAYIELATSGFTNIQATISDGTTTKKLFWPPLNDDSNPIRMPVDTWLKTEVYYKSGRFSLNINGNEVSRDNSTLFSSLNNSNAVLTIGNSFETNASFKGTIALLKLSATVPTPDQSIWMYEQEKAMFQPNAQICLPDSNNILNISYDESLNRYHTVSSTNESQWSGLVRTGTIAGSFSNIAVGSGLKLLARTNTVDITNSAFEVKEELLKSNELINIANDNLIILDYIGGFTANITNGSAALASVTNQTVPSNATVINALVEGTGIPTNTVLVATNHLSAAATATTTGLQINFRDFTLPIGYEAKTVSINGVYKQEGSTKDWTRLFDGFRETIRFAVAPGNTAWVQIKAMRS